MAVIPKEASDWLTLFRQQINEIFTFLTSLETKEGAGEREFTPPVDIFETGDRFIVEIDLPGFERSDLSLNVCCNALVVEGVKREDVRDREINFICVERQFGRFCRTIEIPPHVDARKVTARYDKGVLWVTFPRLAEKTVIRNIPIEQGE